MRRTLAIVWVTCLVIASACVAPPGPGEIQGRPTDAGVPIDAGPASVPILSDVTLASGLPDRARGCLIFDDLTGDALPDLLLGEPEPGVVLYRNLGDGTFSGSLLVPEVRHLFSCAAADFDADGVMDLALATGLERVVLLRGQGGGTFEDVSDRGPEVVGDPPEIPGVLAFVDANRDGRQDLFVTSAFVVAGAPNCVRADDGDFTCRFETPLIVSVPRLYRGSAGGFVLVEGAFDPADRRGVTAIGVVDWDADGFLDLFGSVDFGANVLWRNLGGTGAFADVLPATGAAVYNHGMGAAIADLDGDLALDLVIADIGPNQVWLRRGDGLEDHKERFGVAASTRFASTWSPVAADLDHDGRIDVFLPVTVFEETDDGLRDAVANGTLLASRVPQRDLVLIGRDGAFAVFESPHVETSPSITEAAAAVADFDGDGDLDVAEAYGWPHRFRLLRNDTPAAGHWLQVALDPPGSAFTDGATVIVEACGRRQVRVAGGLGGAVGAGWRTVHFGLGACTNPERVEVRWPSGAATVHESGLAADRLVRLSAP